MTKARREKIQATGSQLHAAQTEAKSRQARLNDAAGKLDARFRSFPYLDSREWSNNLETCFAAIKRADYYAQEGWDKKLAPKFEEWQQLRVAAREGWELVKEIEAELGAMHEEVLDVFRAAFNERVNAMHAYLLSVYTPLCESQLGWETQQQLETLLQSTPRYQQLLLIRKYGNAGKDAAGEISSMFSALAKLRAREEADLAAIKSN